MLGANHAGETCMLRQPHWHSLNVATFHTTVSAHLNLGLNLKYIRKQSFDDIVQAPMFEA